MSKNFIIPLGIYPFDVMVSVAQSDSELTKLLVSNGVDLTGISLTQLPNQQGRCIMFTTNQTLIRLYKTPTTNIDYSYLQHEIFHAADFIMNRVGMKLCYKSCEAYAYLIQYLTEKIYDKL